MRPPKFLEAKRPDQFLRLCQNLVKAKIEAKIDAGPTWGQARSMGPGQDLEYAFIFVWFVCHIWLKLPGRCKR